MRGRSVPPTTSRSRARARACCGAAVKRARTSTLVSRNIPALQRPDRPRHARAAITGQPATDRGRAVEAPVDVDRRCRVCAGVPAGWAGPPKALSRSNTQRLPLEVHGASSSRPSAKAARPARGRGRHRSVYCCSTTTSGGSVPTRPASRRRLLQRGAGQRMNRGVRGPSVGRRRVPHSSAVFVAPGRIKANGQAIARVEGGVQPSQRRAARITPSNPTVTAVCIIIAR